MAFGFAALPTKRYVYAVPKLTCSGTDARTGQRIQFPLEPFAVDQLWLASRYHRRLVENERERRRLCDDLVHAHSPALLKLRTDAEKLSTDLAAARAQIAQEKILNEGACTNTVLLDLARDLATQRAAAWTAHKALKATVYRDPVLKPQLQVLDTQARDRAKEIDSEEAAAGLGWGTRLDVNTRVKRTGPPPQLPELCEEGTIAVQLQAKATKGAARVPVLDSKGKPRLGRSGKPMTAPTSHRPCTVAELMRGLPDAKLTQRPPAPDGTANNWYDLSLRIAGASSEPVIVPVILHRPIPVDATIKWIKLLRKREADRYSWEVHFELARAEGWQPTNHTRPSVGVVAVALGWRKIGDEIRVAHWRGDDGVTGDVVIPAKRVEQYLNIETLQSNSDYQFEQQKRRVAAALAALPLTPEWQDEVRTLAQWQNPSRLMQLVRWWRTHRIPGDESIFAELERTGLNLRGKSSRRGWRAEHRLDWWTREHKRGVILRWRKWYYRQVARKLGARYARVILSNTDWNEIAEAPAIESTEPKVNRHYQSLSASASFADQLWVYASPVEVVAANTVRMCYRCGAIGPAPGAGQFINCERCSGGPVDRADNACIIMLRRALGRMSPI